MKERIITVTEAARNFSDCVSRVHYQEMTFVLQKNGKSLACLVPARARRCTGRDLAEALANAQLSAEEACAWHVDLKAAREILKVPRDKWQ